MEAPALRQFMGGYLHQDFDVVGTVEENLELFARTSPRLADALPLEIDHLLAEDRSEAELEDLLDEMGCQAAPPSGTTYREWLTQIADRVRQATV